MKKRLLALSFAGLVAISFFGLQTAAQTPAKEKHPAIHAAIRALEKAKTEMQNAAHDFGGHRVAALAECDKAIAELNAALQYAK